MEAVPRRAPSPRCTAESVHHVWHRWTAAGQLAGLRPGCAAAVRAVADLAERYGLLLQIVLGTAHFLRWGESGAYSVINRAMHTWCTPTPCTFH